MTSRSGQSLTKTEGLRCPQSDHLGRLGMCPVGYYVIVRFRISAAESCRSADGQKGTLSFSRLRHLRHLLTPPEKVELDPATYLQPTMGIDPEGGHKKLQSKGKMRRTKIASLSLREMRSNYG